jgi:ferrous iron transport protein B
MESAAERSAHLSIVTPEMVTGLSRVALAGNPNAGKTSIFNWLTGSSQKVGNYPGVTVERHIGRLELPSGSEVEIYDTPGTYSLSARSAEEQIASQAIVGLSPLPAPDLVVVVVDATQLLRNLYLTLQVVETGTPIVVALTMVDLLERSGQTIDVGHLESTLGIPVVPVSGLTGGGIDQLKKAAGEALSRATESKDGPLWPPSPELEADVSAVADKLPEEWTRDTSSRRRALALWALLSIDEEDELVGIAPELRESVDSRRQLAAVEGRDIEAEIISARYAWIDLHCSPALSTPDEPRTSLTGRLDSLLLHPVSGFALFLLTMGLVFQSLFSWADPAIGLVESAFNGLSSGVIAVMPEGILRDFITEGLIAGVGGVVVFLPQILLLFFFIGLMEDSGYMARVAFLMDRLMKSIGLHGRAFVPMLSGFACAVPAILATRTMERRRDRMITMMVVPLMSCSARLPVYTLLIAALYDTESKVLGFLPVQSLLMVAMYLFSTIIALVAAAILGKTVFKGPQVPLILELPPYRMPQLRSVIRMMMSRAGVFLREAGGVILVCTVVLWGLLSFPKQPTLDTDYSAMRIQIEREVMGDELQSELLRIDNLEAGEIFRKSYGARLGQSIEPVIEPLGFDWKIGIGLIGAFAAREVFVSTMGIVYGVSDEVDEGSESLRERIRNEKWADGRTVYTPLVGLSLMVFIALACQCMSTLAAVYRETNSWRWPVFMFVYMTSLAWIGSLIIYQGGRWIGFD